MAGISTNIEALINAVIDREGGYSNHPADRGGPTRWGVTEQRARAYGYRGDMRVYPREHAVKVYREMYWHRPGFDAVAPAALAEELFDIGVNMGPTVAGMMLQRCLNVLNQGAAHYADLHADGSCGPLTIAALDAYRRRRGVEGDERLLLAVRSLRGARYIEISEQRPANEAFTYGWFGRMVEMAKAAIKAAVGK